MEQVVTFIDTMVGEGHDPRYWPINQYGVIGDCRTAALIGPNGRWTGVVCHTSTVERLSAGCWTPIRAASFVSVSPHRPGLRMSYMPGTNILETIFSNEHGRLRLVDFAPIRKRPPKSGLREQLAEPGRPHPAWTAGRPGARSRQ